MSDTMMVEIKNYNRNQEIERVATRVGANVGGITAAVVGGVATGIWSLFQGARVGIVVTHADMDNVQVPVQNTSIAAKQRHFSFEGGKFREITPENQGQQQTAGAPAAA